MGGGARPAGETRCRDLRRASAGPPLTSVIPRGQRQRSHASVAGHQPETLPVEPEQGALAKVQGEGPCFLQRQRRGEAGFAVGAVRRAPIRANERDPAVTEPCVEVLRTQGVLFVTEL